MGEGSAHSEHYFATAYLAKVEGSAHSGCYFARPREMGEAARIHIGTVTRTTRAARIQSVPSRVCGTIGHSKRRGIMQ